MNKLIIIITLIGCLISCDDNREIVKRYKNGNVESIHYYGDDKKIDSSYFYYPTKKLKQIVYFKEEDTLSYTKMYDEDGNNIAEGNIVRNNLDFRTGRWFLYGDKETDSIVEFFNVDNKPYLNQIWVLNKDKKDTVYDRGNFYYIYNRDTISVNDTIDFRFYLYQPYYDYNSDMLVVMFKDDNQMRKSFSNINVKERDTFYSLKNDGISHPEIPKEVPQNHNANFGIVYREPGEKRIRGYISEYIKDEKDTTERIERRLFFDKTIYVLDTIK